MSIKLIFYRKKTRTIGMIDEFISSSSEENTEYFKYILVNYDKF